jgi:hypothetical protein
MDVAVRYTFQQELGQDWLFINLEAGESGAVQAVFQMIPSTVFLVTGGVAMQNKFE